MPPSAPSRTPVDGPTQPRRTECPRSGLDTRLLVDRCGMHPCMRRASGARPSATRADSSSGHEDELEGSVRVSDYGPGHGLGGSGERNVGRPLSTMGVRGRERAARDTGRAVTGAFPTNLRRVEWAGRDVHVPGGWERSRDLGCVAPPRAHPPRTKASPSTCPRRPVGRGRIS